MNAIDVTMSYKTCAGCGRNKESCQCNPDILKAVSINVDSKIPVNAAMDRAKRELKYAVLTSYLKETPTDEDIDETKFIAIDYYDKMNFVYRGKVLGTVTILDAPLLLDPFEYIDPLKHDGARIIFYQAITFI